MLLNPSGYATSGTVPPRPRSSSSCASSSRLVKTTTSLKAKPSTSFKTLRGSLSSQRRSWLCQLTGQVIPARSLPTWSSSTGCSDAMSTRRQWLLSSKSLTSRFYGTTKTSCLSPSVSAASTQSAGLRTGRVRSRGALWKVSTSRRAPLFGTGKPLEWLWRSKIASPRVRATSTPGYDLSSLRNGPRSKKCSWRTPSSGGKLVRPHFPGSQREHGVTHRGTPPVGPSGPWTPLPPAPGTRRTNPGHRTALLPGAATTHAAGPDRGMSLPDPYPRRESTLANSVARWVIG